MGNLVSPCGRQTGGSSSTVKLIFWEGNTRDLSGHRRLAGEIMFEFPDQMVCHADSFFIGRPIPVLNIDDELMPGETYFVLPLDHHFSCTNVLSAASLAALISSPNKPTATGSTTTPTINFKEFSPFEYIKDLNGRVLIKVMPEFLAKLITRGQEITDGKSSTSSSSNSSSHGFLCSTPELKKQYDQLVGDREQLWSPKLETISEFKPRHSPCRFIGLDRRRKEEEET